MNDARHVAAVVALHGLNPALPLYRVLAPEYRLSLPLPSPLLTLPSAEIYGTNSRKNTSYNKRRRKE
jgi:hypothetical protein